jgi:hypothetical protein
MCGTNAMVTLDGGHERKIWQPNLPARIFRRRNPVDPTVTNRPHMQGKGLRRLQANDLLPAADRETGLKRAPQG